MKRKNNSYFKLIKQFIVISMAGVMVFNNINTITVFADEEIEEIESEEIEEDNICNFDDEFEKSLENEGDIDYIAPHNGSYKPDGASYYIEYVFEKFPSSSVYSLQITGCSGDIKGELIIPETIEGVKVTAITSKAFYRCNKLTGNLIIPDSVKSIGEMAFEECSGLTGDLVIPNSVTTIGERAFTGCRGFDGILSISNSMTVINDFTFYNCTGLKGKLNIPNGVTSIGTSAFYCCSGLTGDLIIPNSVTAIKGGAFYNCMGLTGDIVIPDSVTSIGSDAFKDCVGFDGTLAIPDSVTSMRYPCFDGCSNLSRIINNSGIEIDLLAVANKRWENEVTGECILKISDGSAISVYNNPNNDRIRNPIVDKDITTWDCIYFGNYWQNDTNYDGVINEKDEKQLVKWRVLDVDDNKALLISDKILDYREYNVSGESTTWKNSTIRSWLNGYVDTEKNDSFIDSAFSLDEQNAICQSNLINADNIYYGTSGGDNTQDKIFLLSYADVVNSEYGFGNCDDISKATSSDDGRVAENTLFSKNDNNYSSDDSGDWWLRSPAYGNDYAVFTDESGRTYLDGDNVGKYKGIRPAVYINLLYNVWSYAGSVSSEGTIKSSADAENLINPKTKDGIVTWDCIYFGNYWQNDTNGDGIADTDDEKEPIKWRVLSVNGNDAFLISDKNLDCTEYHKTKGKVSWEYSTIRSWLNGYGNGQNSCYISYYEDNFLDNAFTNAEQRAISKSSLENPNNPDSNIDGGKNTLDKVFLLSYDDCLKTEYGFCEERFFDDIARAAKNTTFAKNRGADTNQGANSVGNGYWWLRTPGDEEGYTLFVERCVFSGGRSNNSICNAVRPALHLDLNSDVWEYAGTVSTDGTECVSPHMHKYASEYTNDENAHWYAATCKHTDKRDQFEPHISSGPATEDEAEVCTVCGYEIEPKKVYQKVTVILDCAGGKLDYPDTVVVKVGLPYPNLPIPHREGYVFKGWYYINKLITNDTIVEVAGNHILSAHWDIEDNSDKQFILFFNANGGSVDLNAKIIEVGKKYGVLPVPSKSGYKFTGWYTETEDGEQITEDSIVSLATNHTVYAHWNKIDDNPPDNPVDDPSKEDTKDEDDKPSNDYNDRWIEKESKITDKEYIINLSLKEKYIIDELKKTLSDNNNYKITYDKTGNKSDSQYASFAANGLITAKKPGVAHITVKKGDTEYKITVNVYNPQFKYENPKNKFFVTNVGEKITPDYEDCKIKPVFTIDNKSARNGIATINPETGELTALKKGIVTVTATVGGEQNAKYARKVSTKVKIFDPTFADFKIGKNGVINQLPIGKTLALKIKGGYGSTAWSVSDNKIAKIDNKNRLVAVGFGTTTVTAINNGRVIKKEIVVPLPEITSAKDTVLVNKTLTLKLKNGIARPKTVWSVSDEKIATITQGGVLKGVAPGRVIVTAENSGVKVEKEITVE